MQNSSIQLLTLIYGFTDTVSGKYNFVEVDYLAGVLFDDQTGSEHLHQVHLCKGPHEQSPAEYSLS